MPNPFVANWIETHYQVGHRRGRQGRTGRRQAVLVTVDPALSGPAPPAASSTRRPQLVATADQRPQRARRARREPHRCDTTWRTSSSATATAWPTRPPWRWSPRARRPFNPLFIHGACGVGKTHLLQGICNAAASTAAPGGPLRWRYVTGEQFTNEFISALRHKKIEEFRDRYRKLDLLAIDDVHFLSAKKATQDEFLHTFNAIESAGQADRDGLRRPPAAGGRAERAARQPVRRRHGREDRRRPTSRRGWRSSAAGPRA